MLKQSLLAVLSGVVLFFSGCNTTDPGSETYKYDPQKPYAWVHDFCGDSARVNWSYDPDHPGDENARIFDSVSVPAVRIRDYGTRQDTDRITVNVDVVSNISGEGGSWDLGTRLDDSSPEETGKDYYEYVRAFSCFTYGFPRITKQPVSQSTYDGAGVTFSVEATDGVSGNEDDYNIYNWYKNGVLQEDSLNPGSSHLSHFSFMARLSDNNAKFKVILNNTYGKVTSKEATLTVKPAAP